MNMWDTPNPDDQHSETKNQDLAFCQKFDPNFSPEKLEALMKPKVNSGSIQKLGFQVADCLGQSMRRKFQCALGLGNHIRSLEDL